MIQKEFDKLPEKENNFDLDFSDLAEEFEKEKQEEMDHNQDDNNHTQKKIQIKEKNLEYNIRMSKKRKVCAESLKQLIGFDEKAELKNKIIELKGKEDPENILEREALLMMAEDLSVSDVSICEEDEIPTEFFEKAEMLLMKENYKFQDSIDEISKILDVQVFNEEFYIDKGLVKSLLEKKISQENEISLANEINFQTHRINEISQFLKDFQNVRYYFLIIFRNPKKFQILKKKHLFLEG